MDVICYREDNRGNGVWVVIALGDFAAPANGTTAFIRNHPDLKITATTLLRLASGQNDFYWLMIVTEPRNT
jgi:hypothetical protein